MNNMLKNTISIIRTYLIPVGGISREDAEKSLRELMSRYNQETDISAWIRDDRKKKLDRIIQNDTRTTNI